MNKCKVLPEVRVKPGTYQPTKRELEKYVERSLAGGRNSRCVQPGEYFGGLERLSFRNSVEQVRRTNRLT